MGIRLRQLLGVTPRIVADPYDLPAVVCVFDALSEFGPVVAGYERMVAHLGADERLSLEALTRAQLDFDAMERLPDGTLGREYMRFLATYGLAREYHLQAYPASARTFDANWVMLRFAKTHDFHHVALGLDAHLPDEIALQIGNWVNFREPYGIASVVLLPYVLLRYAGQGLRILNSMWRTIPQVGRVENLFTFRWEEHLETPVVELRERLRIPVTGLV
jgi:ubiquinone biosynthesis protein COQ4